jgi:NDP-sugar pyrophosphorylase family protein
MKSYGPPSLINIANHRLIDIQIEAIGKTFKYYEIILCVGFDAEKISKYVRNKYNNINIRIVENQLYNSSNSCESARLALNNTINDQVLICDGNLLINSETLSLVNAEYSTVILESNPCSNLEVGVNVDEKNEAQHFSFGASNIWSEILYLNNQEIIESLRRIMCGADYKSRFIFEALNELIKTKHKLKCVKNEHSIKKINNVKTYHAITR